MQPKTRPTGQTARSFIEQARRAQIVDAAVETIAEVGYARASLERIAERAGISRGLISYHFAGKDELIAQVLTTVYSEAAAFMTPRIDTQSSAAGQLRVYIESNLAYMAAHPNRMVAAVEIVIGGALARGLPGIDPRAGDEAALAHLEELFRRGQESGEFRAFDRRTMARALRNVIDGIPAHIADPDLDLDACARELTMLFDLATRSADAAPPPAEAHAPAPAAEAP